MLPAGRKEDSFVLCVTVDGVDAFLAKSPVTIELRVWCSTVPVAEMGPGLNLWPVTRPDLVSEHSSNLSLTLGNRVCDLYGRSSNPTILVGNSSVLGRQKFAAYKLTRRMLITPVNFNVMKTKQTTKQCMRNKASLMICECRPRLTWQNYTIRLLQITLQLTQLWTIKHRFCHTYTFYSHNSIT